MRVLLADDDESFREVLRVALERIGCEVIEAVDGRQAWELFDREPVGVIVSDWAMPEMDGLTLCRRVRERPDTDYTYFILVTGNTAQGDYEMAMSVGVDDFLGKPPVVGELYARLKVAQRIVGLTRRVKQLEGILPICTFCQRIRRPDDVYEGLEAFVEARSRAAFSHGVCPDCLAKRT